jgi:hypothetical protein
VQYRGATVPASLVLTSLCSALSFGFAAVLLGRFLHRGRPYYGVWALALTWYGLSTGAEFVGGAVAWNTATYRWWYLTGAIGVAAYLGAGSIYLHRAGAFGWLVVAGLVLGAVPALVGGLAPIVVAAFGAVVVLVLVLLRRPEHLPHAVFGVLIVGSVLAAARIFTVPLDAALLPRQDEIATGQAFGADVRLLSPLFNIPGALALLLGALASALHYWRLRGSLKPVLSNVLIAAGALVPSLSSGLTRFGWSSALYIGEFVGLLCILSGFMVRDRTSGPPRPRPSA